VEARPQEGWAVLGIGVNVATSEFPRELAETATSLVLAGAAASVDWTLAALLTTLDHWLPCPPEEVLAAWRPRDALLGQTIRWENGSKEGVAAGIDSSGALLVETASGRVTLDAGEVHLER
jgi:BirA family biotin operon repressor/biotin-[acetyl-CoA-carboxylase] ligase